MSTALLSCLSFEGVKVRVVGTPESPCWVAADVGAVLGIEKVRNTIEDFEPDEKGAHTVSTPGGPQEMLTLTEPGLYRLIFISRKPDAAKFRRWVFHEVLPQIRRTGSYAVAPTALEERVARLEQSSLAARVEKLEQLALFSSEPKQLPKRRFRMPEWKRAEQLTRLVKTWGEEFGDQFVPLADARRVSVKIAALVVELGDEVRHLLRAAHSGGLMESQHASGLNTKAWRPAGAAERN